MIVKRLNSPSDKEVKLYLDRGWTIAAVFSEIIQLELQPNGNFDANTNTVFVFTALDPL